MHSQDSTLPFSLLTCMRCVGNPRCSFLESSQVVTEIDRQTSSAEDSGPPVASAAGVGPRARCDVVSMRLNINVWTQMVKQLTLANIYLFANSSPQWRGAEPFPSQMERFMGTHSNKSFSPLVTITRSMLSAVGKAFGLFWQVFLETGPSIYDASRLCVRVRSFTIDIGVEKYFLRCETSR